MSAPVIAGGRWRAYATLRVGARRVTVTARTADAPDAPAAWFLVHLEGSPRTLTCATWADAMAHAASLLTAPSLSPVSTR